MNITVIGAGNSGLAMAAHLSKERNNVILWNRSKSTISKLIETQTIYCEGIINDQIKIDLVTDDIEKAVENPDVILITTPANSHKELAEQIAKVIKKETLIVLNPGRTFGALEFDATYRKHNQEVTQTIAETQTIIYTCRKTGEDSVNIISLKSGVLISTFNSSENKNIIMKLPECIQKYFIPARSMIETSIGNVGMILHCAPLLLNTGWTESESTIYKYYYDGITPTVGRLVERIDEERVAVSRELGLEVETTKEWLKRTYNINGNTLYECIQNNEAYKTIDAPCSLRHRYIFEDVPCGLVPLETIGKKLGLNMKNTSVIIDLASSLMDVDFRKVGRNLDYFHDSNSKSDFKNLFSRGNR
ncbi:NAD/NADP-dependent octopine/nopaline dehydrogenase family protein [Proteiniborus sp. MB09-C3]|uniref:NAD/NADP-dependent octopine/nopaline dehydrogenase family protein n=1 Tax=Proteiniborus sp. MB09-C3 TaxID=3050072 RepID=UPI0025544E1B|nr:NAD/NADP-dependent octopine/nopaline dehydrogenase family protein [Proteiniborus sp. MB09-C3]WIV12120.1 NAD/NADP octopine/nopaline dehydrogenase family protein [Proteiniborus sp. MB09-C3]